MKILLADDHSLFKEGMEMIIKRVLPDAKVILGDNWQQVHAFVQQDHYDLALLDLFMPRLHSWEQELTQLINNAPELPICIITASTVKGHIKKAMDLGVKGFIHKTLSIEETQTALLRVQQGLYYLPPTDHYKSISRKPNIGKLTVRQKEILALLVKGQSNKMIGFCLDITETTVKRHVYNIYQLLGVKNRMDVTKIVEEQGLLL